MGGVFGSDQENIGVLRADVAPVGKRYGEDARPFRLFPAIDAEL